MSVVAVRKTDTHIEIAADSIMVRGYLQEKHRDAKMYKVNDSFVIGSAGYSRDFELLRIFLKSHMPAENSVTAFVDLFAEFAEWVLAKDASIRMDTHFIIAFDGKVYTASTDLYVREIEETYAIGAGYEFAQAALLLGNTAKEAVRVACELSIYCEEPVVSYKLPL